MAWVLTTLAAEVLYHILLRVLELSFSQSNRPLNDPGTKKHERLWKMRMLTPRSALQRVEQFLVRRVYYLIISGTKIDRE